ncbi:hypothetical protein, partial [Parvibaculum sp.]|uniref:hypothetical protein n=1 Tax=Parvibaculum sp. TaxID=2024848 RepID=UPI0034A07C13
PGRRIAGSSFCLQQYVREPAGGEPAGSPMSASLEIVFPVLARQEEVQPVLQFGLGAFPGIAIYIFVTNQTPDLALTPQLDAPRRLCVSVAPHGPKTLRILNCDFPGNPGIEAKRRILDYREVVALAKRGKQRWQK